MLYYFFCVFILGLPNLAVADGALVPPQGRYVWENRQQAVILFEDNFESLVVSISFRGNAEDFAWLVPTPSIPEVSKVNFEIFNSLEDLTILAYEEPRPLMLKGDRYIDQERAVEVIDERQIDYYNIKVVKANSADDLLSWLNQHDYYFPAESVYILEDYIERGWVFTAVSIVDEYSSQSVTQQLKTGQAIPLRLDFKTSQPVYPLKISGVEFSQNNEVYRDYAERPVGILLYVVAGDKYQLPGFDTRFAGWIKGEDLSQLAFSDTGEVWHKFEDKKYFLTKMYTTMPISQMTYDLFLRKSPDNQTMHAPAINEQRNNNKFIGVALSGFILLVVLLVVLWVHHKGDKQFKF